MTTRTQKPSTTTLFYKPGIDIRGRPKIAQVLVGCYTTKEMKRDLVSWARAEKVTASQLFREILEHALRAREGASA
jgi:hypothetical protein